MKTIYLNAKLSQGRETIDEFSPEKGQGFREFNKYIREMITEYRIAGIPVYKSSRPCNNWNK